MESRTKIAFNLFFISVLGLFLEICLIRWVSAELRIFAYFKNLVLISAFLGFGIGCFLYRAERNYMLWAIGLIVVLILLIKAPFDSIRNFGPQIVTRGLSNFNDFQVFTASSTPQFIKRMILILYSLGWVLLIFFCLVIAFIPYGQVLGRYLNQFKNNLAAYSINIFGSLIGILLFTLCSYLSLPPTIWIAAPLLFSIPYVSGKVFNKTAAFALAFIAFFILNTPDVFDMRTQLIKTIWSPYQKLQLVKSHNLNILMVNNTSFHTMSDIQDLNEHKLVHIPYYIPYYLKKNLKRVIVVGAGSGNDAEAGLKCGVQSITAVEIDPEIIHLGKLYHPAQPYLDPRVKVVIDDARHAFGQEQEQFDLALFSQLDSHTLLSGYTNVRLDNYIYTIESFKKVRDVMKEDGLCYVAFWAEKDWIWKRLYKNLTKAFGHEPIAFNIAEDRSQAYDMGLLITKNPNYLQQLLDASPMAKTFIGKNRWSFNAKASDIPISTDDWPFLYVEAHRMPNLILIISLLIFAISLLAYYAAPIQEKKMDFHFFFLGAGFLLVEVHNVSKLALIFGTTWYVNTWAIAAVLVMILLANLYTKYVQVKNLNPYYIGLFFALFISYFINIDIFNAMPFLFKAVGSCLVVTLPIFFAGIIFATSFSRSAVPSSVFGANMLGSILGGLSENISMITGIRSLILIAAGFYLVSWIACIGKKQ